MWITLVIGRDIVAVQIVSVYFQCLCWFYYINIEGGYVGVSIGRVLKKLFFFDIVLAHFVITLALFGINFRTIVFIDIRFDI